VTILQQVTTFWVDDILLALDIERVREVLTATAVTPVPGADPSIRGILNLRGELITALDVRRRLGRPSAADGGELMFLVVRTPREPFCLVADREGEVADVDDLARFEVPETVDRGVRSVSSATLRLDAGVAVLLDVDELVQLGPTRAG